MWIHISQSKSNFEILLEKHVHTISRLNFCEPILAKDQPPYYYWLGINPEKINNYATFVLLLFNKRKLTFFNINDECDRI